MAHSSFAIGPILGTMKSVPIPAKPFGPAAPEPLRPFVTISREPGAGAIGVSHRFIELMNADAPDDQKWTCWDRELVEKVAADHHLKAREIEGLEESDHSWIGNFFKSLSFADSGASPDEDVIYQKVKRTVEALASAGRVVIIGRGGVFITSHIPGGIHIRLVSPFKNRVTFVRQKLGLSERTAIANIREVEKNRRAFFRMHWPIHTLDPESFAMTINTAEVEVESIAQMLRTLVQRTCSMLSVSSI